jgi:hypothetical protein
MTGHFVELAALLVQPHPETALLVEDVAHIHAAGRGDAGNREDHHTNQSTIPQPRDSVVLDGAQQLAGLLGGQHGGFALPALLARGFHRVRGVVLQHSAGDQVVEELADGGHVLLEVGGRKVVGLRRFAIVAHVERADVLHAHPAAVLEEGEERAKRPASDLFNYAASTPASGPCSVQMV